MTLVVVERSFEVAVDVGALQAQEDAVASCLDDHRVRALYSYASRDGRNMVCVYEAPDAEAVRIVQRAASLPYDRIWSAERVDMERDIEREGASGGKGASGGELPEGYTRVVVQRELPVPMDAATVRQAAGPVRECLARRKGLAVESLLGRDTTRMVCSFMAVDAESVRESNHEAGMPLERAWPALRLNA